ncbi:MAG: hypothetical protein HYS17_04615 [Micavibrio aeruginosavorus]|uniref:Uncharacterized protein n=1 Tax=Micavibrio aeruginosavorus TaxID=349221 RepID=A0A7T5R3V7_9BACT|nr:MAG: hypothetical protein HYS17_04615 [Micavibrio aeruginosavorus]
MNDDIIERLKQGGVEIFGDNGELIVIAGPGVLSDFLNATALRHFSHAFNPEARGKAPAPAVSARSAVQETGAACPWQIRGHVYCENGELMTINP